MTWLNCRRPEGMEIIHVHGRPLGKIGQFFDDAHERIRYKSKSHARFLYLLDNLIFFPLRGFIPKIELSKRLRLRDGVFEVNFPDSYVTYKWKELSYFLYFINCTNHNFLISTTNSSYLDLDGVSALLNELPKSGVYIGGKPYDGAEFVSGSFRVYSRDVVQHVLKNRRHFDPSRLEDVAIGRVIRNGGFEIGFTQIINIQSKTELNSLGLDTLKNNFHFRVKSGSHTNRDDVSLMLTLHDKVLQIKKGLTR